MSEQEAEPWVKQTEDQPKQEDPPFQIGDVVQLKSGGPKMTVSALEWSAPSQILWISTLWHRADGCMETNNLINARLLKKAETNVSNSGTESPAGS